MNGMHTATDVRVANTAHRAGRVRRWRAALVALGCTLGVVLIGLAAIGLYYSNSFEDEALTPHHNAPTFDLRVTAVGDGTVTLNITSKTNKSGFWSQPGVWGLQWPTGYGQVSTIAAVDATHVVRQFKLMEGTLAVGELVRTDSFAFPGDPLRGLGLPFSDVNISGPLGALPAWFVDATGDDWAILVHGQGSERRDMLRPLRAVHAAGLKALVVSYRNDVGAPPETDGQYHYGETEWRDVDAAAAYAMQHGAKHLVIVGHSMGGALVMSFLANSTYAANVRAVVLDSPLVDVETTIRWRAEGRAPGPVLDFGMWVSAIRFGVNWEPLDYLATAPGLHAPMLVFHGDDDRTVPLETSEALAVARPDIVTLVTWHGVGHVRSWNADPAAYDRMVEDFLAQTSAATP